MLITPWTCTRPTTSSRQRDIFFQYPIGCHGFEPDRSISSYLTTIGFVAKAGRMKAFLAKIHQTHPHPPLLPLPIPGGLTTKFDILDSHIMVVPHLFAEYRRWLSRVKLQYPRTHLIWFSLGSLPTSQNCDSISLEHRFSLPLRQVHISPPLLSLMAFHAHSVPNLYYQAHLSIIDHRL